MRALGAAPSYAEMLWSGSFVAGVALIMNRSAATHPEPSAFRNLRSGHSDPSGPAKQVKDATVYMTFYYQ